MPIILTGRTGWRSPIISPSPERMGGRFATPEFSHLWNYLALGARLVKHPYNIIGGKNATWDLAPVVGPWGPGLTQSDSLSVDFVYHADYSFGPYPWSLCLVVDVNTTPVNGDAYCSQQSGAFNVASEWAFNVNGAGPADHRINYFTTATQAVQWNDDTGLVLGKKVICVSRDEGGIWRLWINGLYYGTVTEPATPTAVAANVFAIGARTGGTAANLNGDYYAAYIWKNYALNHADAALLTRDPFGLLTPRRRLWVPVSAGGGGAAAQSSTVSAAPVVIHAPGVTTSVGGVSRTLSAATVVLHAPAVITVAGGVTRAVAAASVVVHAPAVATTANVTRVVSAAPLVVHAPAVATSVGAVTRTISAGPLIVHAPGVTASVSVVGTVIVGSAGVVVHAPAVATTPGAVSRTLSAAPIIAHAPAVVTVPGALTRVVSAAPLVLHAPAVSTSVGAATRLISAAPLVVHAPQVATTTGAVARTIGSAVTVIHAPAVTASITFSQTKAITSATMILHAPALANAYSLLYPVPPLGASADDLRQAVSVDDLRTAVSVDNLSASVSLY